MDYNEIVSLIPSWIINSKTQFLIITDLVGNYIFVNDHFKERFSFLAENFIGISVTNSIHPDDLEKCKKASMDCIANPNSIFNLIIRKPIDTNGVYNQSNWEFSLFKDKSGLPQGILCLGNDLTELEKRTKLINEYSAKMETIIENITDGFYIIDRDWKFLAMNKVAETVLGVRFDEVHGKYFWDYLPDSTYYNYPLHFKKAMFENTSIHFEDYKRDTNKWYSCILYPSKIGLTIFFRDITEEKKIQESLQSSENKLRALLDSSTDSNILISRDYKILCYNKSANEMCKKAYGLELQENSSIFDYVMEKDQADFKRDFSRALEGEIVSLEKEIKFETFSFWTEASFFPVYDVSRRVISVTYNSSNIDVRKRSEEKLKESEATLHSIYNSSTEAITLLDKNFNILYNNKVARSVTEEVFGRHAQKGEYSLDYMLPAFRGEFLSYYKKVLEGETICVEKFHDGLWWLFTLFPVYDSLAELVGISHNVKDITEFKKDQFKIISQNTKLREIAWIQSHRVRQHTANILGLCNIFLEHKELSETDKEKNILYLLESAKNLDKVIHEIVKHTDDTAYNI